MDNKSLTTSSLPISSANARLLINAWAVAHDRPCPWHKAVKILGVICGLSAEVQMRLIELDNE